MPYFKQTSDPDLMKKKLSTTTLLLVAVEVAI